MTRTRRTASAQPAVIDACCLIDLLASGRIEAILRAAGRVWNLPSAIQAEIQYVRRHDPDNSGSHRNEPVDLAPLVDSGLLAPCQPVAPHEQARYIHYAAMFRSDGEAMCLALAECRSWTMATDDRKAIQVARKAGLSVVSCPELIRAWVQATRPDSESLVQVLTHVQTLAQFRPNPSMPDYQWWLDQLPPVGP